MALVVCVAVPDVVDEDIGNRTSLVAAFAQQHVERVSHSRELLSSSSGIIEEVQDKSRVEA
jgi:hypothetical protein